MSTEHFSPPAIACLLPLNILTFQKRPGPQEITTVRYTSLLPGGITGLNVQGFAVSAGTQYTELRLLAYLAQNPKQVLSRDQLLASVWGYDNSPDTEQVVTANIPELILTVLGIG